MAASLIELTRYLDDLLDPGRFTDYAPNGLQVEGRPEVSRVVTAVSANQAAIDAAIDAGADAMVVHHGFFWRNEERTVVGHRAKRLTALLRAGISLIAYHLPLDAHEEVGNNVGLLTEIGAPAGEPFGGRAADRLGWDAGGSSGARGGHCGDLAGRRPGAAGLRSRPEHGPGASPPSVVRARAISRRRWAPERISSSPESRPK